MDQSLVSVMKNIGTALQLDSDNNYQGAYVKYAECTLSIVSTLLHKIKTDGGRVVACKQVIQHVKLGQQCMDRLAALVHALAPAPNSRDTKSFNPSLLIGSSLPPIAKRFSEAVPPLHPDASPYAFSRKHDPRPMELAKLRNQQLMQAYKSRLARMNKGSQATQLSLTIQRKMAENLAIAKAQEDALAKKMQERQQRLEEQAKRRFTAPIGMSEEEKEQRQIYKTILEYEQDAKWLTTWRQKLEQNPDDPIVINQLIQEILRCSDHPLTQLLKKYQYKIYERLYPIVCNKMKQLKDITVPLPPHLIPVTDRGGTTEEPSVSAGGTTEYPSETTGGTMEELDISKTGNEDKSDDDNGNEMKPNLDEKDTDTLNNKNLDSEDAESSDYLRNNVSEISLASTDTVDESEIEQVIKEVVENDDSIAVDENVDENVDDNRTIGDFVEESQKNLEDAIAQGSKLEKQLTIESERTSSLIRRISEYEKYNEENMDDLFDDEDIAEDEIQDDQSKDVFDEGSNSPVVDRHSSMPNSVQSDATSGLPAIGNIQKSISMDGGPTSLPSFISPESGSLRPSQSADSLSEEELSKMSEEAYRRHLGGISADVHGYLEKVLLMFTIAYEKLNSPEGRDQCYASLEEPFFKPIWKYILALFRLANRTRETTLAYRMMKGENSQPKDFLVAKKLWLGKSADPSHIPYDKAIGELKKVKEYYTMLSKLECVVRVCRETCACVEDYYATEETERTTPPSVGADDLLPILSYIVVQSKMPQLVSECRAMAEFIHEGYIMGEEGYCLTSLQTAIDFLVSQQTDV